MIVPYSTDAPLYHWPISTISIIVINVIMYFATMFQLYLGNFEQEHVSWLVINYDTINPLQWLTSAFMHISLMDLISNMFFLFAFGLIVEGKIGNFAFAAMYLFISLVANASVQIIMFVCLGEGYVMGASNVIFALLCMAVMWAPENELDCFWLVGIHWGTFEARVLTFGGCFLGIQLLLMTIAGFLPIAGLFVSYILLDSFGILMGFPIAFLLLRMGLVDCEGWDIISRNPWLHKYPFFYSPDVLARNVRDQQDEADPVATALALTGGNAEAGRRLGTSAKRPFGNPEAKSGGSPGTPAPQMARRSKPNLDTAVQSGGNTASLQEQRCRAHPEFNRLAFLIRQGIQNRDLFSTKQAFQQMDELKLTPGLAESTLMQWVETLGQQQQWVDAIRPLAVLASKQGSMADDALLRLAQIQLRILNRPDQSIITLEKIRSPEPEQEIDDARRARLAKRDELLATARRIAASR